MNSIVVHYKELALKGRNRPWFVQMLVWVWAAALLGITYLGLSAITGR